MKEKQLSRFDVVMTCLALLMNMPLDDAARIVQMMNGYAAMQGYTVPRIALQQQARLATVA